jgi:hypothetical protein
MCVFCNRLLQQTLADVQVAHCKAPQQHAPRCRTPCFPAHAQFAVCRRQQSRTLRSARQTRFSRACGAASWGRCYIPGSPASFATFANRKPVSLCTPVILRRRQRPHSSSIPKCSCHINRLQALSSATQTCAPRRICKPVLLYTATHTRPQVHAHPETCCCAACDAATYRLCLSTVNQLDVAHLS